MNVAFCSDLHLELGNIVLENTEDARVLILAGDICTVNDLDALSNDKIGFFRSQRIHNFFSDCASKFDNVIYIMGNHEHYNYSFNLTLNTLREKLGYIPNLYILDKEAITIDDTTFICGTLWSDMNGDDPLTKEFLKTRMNDFRIIYKDGVKFTPNDAILEHRKMIKCIWDTVEDRSGSNKFVVVGHHSPSYRSVHEDYAEDKLMNGGYHSNRDQFIIDRPQIKLWIAGHTHSRHQYYIGDTLLACNPRGYLNYEKIADTFKLEYLDLNNLPSKASENLTQ